MTAPTTRPTLKLLLIADSDSQLLACEALCSAPTTLDVHWTINVIPVSYTHLTLPTNREV